jgi:ribosomal protein L11 methyltransferase
MLWHEVTIYTTEEATEAIADWLHSQGAGGVSIEESGNLERSRDLSFGQWYDEPLNDIAEGDAVMKAYFAQETNMQLLTVALRGFLENFSTFGIDPGRAEIEIASIPEEQWADGWKQYFKPVKISERLVIKPTWETYESNPGELIIEIDPGMAFGTGTHATTALCMRALEHVVKESDHVIDVGTGSGILAVTAAKLGAHRVLALDLDPIAVTSAIENVKLNRLAHRVSVQQSDLLSVVRDTHADAAITLPVQVVVANILAEIIITFVQDVYDVLAPEGVFIASGIIVAKEHDVNQALRDAGFVLVTREEENGWVAIIAKKEHQ